MKLSSSSLRLAYPAPPRPSYNKYANRPAGLSPPSNVPPKSSPHSGANNAPHCSVKWVWVGLCPGITSTVFTRQSVSNTLAGQVPSSKTLSPSTSLAALSVQEMKYMKRTKKVQQNLHQSSGPLFFLANSFPGI
ncbi:hypothetical protein IF1G_09285 [Cordyceps javanica]|uniref:Uncharacterized protein n=1 Tax=Cordyceps javanica TaxID=43265 RepID=A0A545URZ2_9HYPO|nr:hypothetical protein IF1G_09285 [Cordyceps javanica]